MITSRPTLYPHFSHGVTESQLLQDRSSRGPVRLLPKPYHRGQEAPAARLTHFTFACTIPPFSSRAFSDTARRLQKATYHTSVVWISRVKALSTLPLQISKAGPLPIFNPGPLSTTSTRFLEPSLYWRIHAERGGSNWTKLHVLKAFDRYNYRELTKIFGEARGPSVYRTYFRKLPLLNSLPHAPILVVDEIAACLVERECRDISKKDRMGRTPLAWASENGQGLVAKMLLSRADIDPDKPDEGGQTPLMPAAGNGHKGVVKTPPGRDDVNLNKRDEGGGTPLWCAARKAHEAVVKMLPSRADIDPENPGVAG